MNKETLLLGLYAETSLHAGTGQGLGVIDLPIQREAHTGWPCVYGSGMKGALRDRAEQYSDDKEWIQDAFGPEVINGGAENAGAFMITDARLLLLPIRSLTTHFKWVTCPALLQRFAQDQHRLCGQSCQLPELAITDAQALVYNAQRQAHVFLNEFRFQTVEKQTELTSIIEMILPLLGDDNQRSRLETRLVIVSDDIFSHLCQATPVNAHVRLDANKTVVNGALWFEESLPPDTVLYCGIVASDSRRKDSKLKASDLLNQMNNVVFPPDNNYLQIGGNETVGMGWCRVALLKKEG